MSYIVILMSFTAIFPSIGYDWTSCATECNHAGNSNIDIPRSVSKFKKSHDKIEDICIFYYNLSDSDG
jgi:hypothetical protein